MRNDQCAIFLLTSGQNCPKMCDMNGDEFIKKVKKHGKMNNVAVRFDCKQGKGRHGTLYYGDRKTTVKHGEIGPGLLAALLKQLGIQKEDF